MKLPIKKSCGVADGVSGCCLAGSGKGECHTSFPLVSVSFGIDFGDNANRRSLSWTSQVTNDRKLYRRTTDLSRISPSKSGTVNIKQTIKISLNVCGKCYVTKLLLLSIRVMECTYTFHVILDPITFYNI